MTRPADALLDFLRSQEEQGITHVFLDEESRACLRDLHQRAREAARQKVSATTKPASSPAAVASATTRPVPAAGPAKFSRNPAPPASPSPAFSAADLPKITPSGTTKEEQLASLRAQAESWQPARSMQGLRDKMVFAVGNPDAAIVFVGEAPGYEEEKKGEPFVGPAGAKLDDILRAMGLARTDIYISNIVKFRPALPGQTTNNRKPTAEEMAVCMPFIRAELAVIRPRCVVALGSTAAEGLLGASIQVAKLRERWHEIDGIPLRVTYHPSYLLRVGSNLNEKRKVWEDMIAVMEKLGMPVSEKQRGFFLPKP